MYPTPATAGPSTNQWVPSNGSGSYGTASIGASRTTPPISSTIRDLTERIAKARSGIDSQVYRACQIADSYFGAAPETTGMGEPGTRDTVSAADALQIEATRLEIALNTLTLQLDRLSCI